MSDTGGVSRQHCQYLKFQWFRGKYGFVTARRVSDWFQRKIQICRRWPLGRRRKENQWGAPQVVPSFGWRVPHGWKQSILPSGNWRKGGILLSVPNDAHVSRTSKNIYLTERVCVCVCVRCGSGSFCEVNVLPTRQHWLIWQIFWQYLKSDLLPLLIFERLTPEVNKRQSRCRTTTGFIFHFPGQRVDICWLHCFWPAESAEKSAAQVKSPAWHFPFSDESASRCQPKPSTPIGQTRHFAAAILL